MAAAAEYAQWLVQNRDKQGTPDFETVAQAYEVAKRNENSAATQVSTQPPQQKSRSIVESILGAGETALTLGTAATGGLFGTVGGTISGLMDQVEAGKFGTSEGARAVAERAAAGAQRFTYEPRTEAGQENVRAIGKFAQLLPPVLPGAMPVGTISTSVRQAAPIVQATALRGAAAAQDIGSRGVAAVGRTPDAVRGMLGLETSAQAPTGRASIGAAATPSGIQREATAQGLPVPVDLTLGARERTAAQLAFEKEQIRGPQGEPLRQRAELNNQQALLNFDALVDQTGAQFAARGPTATGNAVIDALSKGYAGARAKTSAAYTAADKSPESLAQVDLTVPRAVKLGPDEVSTTLFDYLNSKPTGVPSSAIPDTAKQYALKLGIASRDENGNLVPLPTNVKTLEQLRRELNASTDYNPVNILETVNLKKLIDAATADVSGPLYRTARTLREQQARKYEGRAVVNNLLTTIKGKDDPKVAASEAFEKSIVNSTPEEVTFLRRVLLTSGKDGQAAMRELQGATIKHLEAIATSNNQTDSMGRPIVSSAKFNAELKRLDDGRLDVILGKQRAQLVRDLNEVLQYVNTVPPGTQINTSGTSMAIVTALAEAGTLGVVTGLPLPVLSVIRAAASQIKDNKLKLRINEALAKPKE